MSDCRPIFTGDIFDDVTILGVQEGGKAMVLAHPCTIRGKNAELKENIMVCAVESHVPLTPEKWQNGYYSLVPLPAMPSDGFEFSVGRFDRMGLAKSDQLKPSQRLACLSEEGINILQQRLVFHLTRTEIPTDTFMQAFGHTYEEAELLETWTERLSQQMEPAEAAKAFEGWIRADGRQDSLQNHQQRATVRRAMEREIAARLGAS